MITGLEASYAGASELSRPRGRVDVDPLETARPRLDLFVLGGKVRVRFSLAAAKASNGADDVIGVVGVEEVEGGKKGVDVELYLRVLLCAATFAAACLKACASKALEGAWKVEFCGGMLE